MSESSLPLFTDVLVVGSGAAGLSAAIEAAGRGRRVVLIESEPETGGSTRLSGAYVALCETPLQPGSKEEFLRDLLDSHHHDCQRDLSELYVEEAPETFRQLERFGVNFVNTFQFAHMHKPWAHELSGIEMAGGAEIVHRLEQEALWRGVQIFTDTKAVDLQTKAGRVTGLTVSRYGKTTQLSAGAVILATGGFTRNMDLIRTHGAESAALIHPLTGQGSRGDGLIMGQKVGAETSYLTEGIAPTAPTDPRSGKGVMVLYAGAVALNREGERFCDESALYIDTCWAALKQPEARFVQIYDAPMRAAYADTMMGKVLSGFTEYEATNLRTLLTQIKSDFDVDVDKALATLSRYNNDLEGGSDRAYGRSHLVGQSGALTKIARPPFFAAVCVPGTTHFNGGLRVKANMSVVDANGEAIEGLYAAGEVTGGFHGAGYMSGTFVGMALSFGRIAGYSAVVFEESGL